MMEVAAGSVQAQNVGVDDRPGAHGKCTYIPTESRWHYSQKVLCAAAEAISIASVPTDALRSRSQSPAITCVISIICYAPADGGQGHTIMSAEDNAQLMEVAGWLRCSPLGKCNSTCS